MSSNRTCALCIPLTLPSFTIVGQAVERFIRDQWPDSKLRKIFPGLPREDIEDASQEGLILFSARALSGRIANIRGFHSIECWDERAWRSSRKYTFTVAYYHLIKVHHNRRKDADKIAHSFDLSLLISPEPDVRTERDWAHIIEHQHDFYRLLREQIPSKKWYATYLWLNGHTFVDIAPMVGRHRNLIGGYIDFTVGRIALLMSQFFSISPTPQLIERIFNHVKWQ